MDNATIVVLIGAASGLSALALRICYLSKCIKVKLCCLEIDRAVASEQQISIDNNQTPTRPASTI